MLIFNQHNHTQWPAPTLSPPPHRAHTPSASLPSGLSTLSQPAVSAHPCGSSYVVVHDCTLIEGQLLTYQYTAHVQSIPRRPGTFRPQAPLGPLSERAPHDGKRIGRRRTRSAATEPRAMYIYRGSRYQALDVKQTEPPPASRYR
jgi:hypothetical protein